MIFEYSKDQFIEIAKGLKTIDGNQIPKRMIQPLADYVFDRKETGDFLRAVLENNLLGAFSRADEENSKVIYLYVLLLYNYAPSGCCGSKEKVNEWLNS